MDKNLLKKNNISSKDITYLVKVDNVINFSLKDGSIGFYNNEKLVVIKDNKITYSTYDETLYFNTLTLEECEELKNELYESLKDNTKIKLDKYKFQKKEENSDLKNYYFDVLKKIGFKKEDVIDCKMNRDYSMDFRCYYNDENGITVYICNISFENVVIMSKKRNNDNEEIKFAVYDIDKDRYFIYQYEDAKTMAKDYNRFLKKRNKSDLKDYISYIVTKDDQVSEFHISDNERINELSEYLYDIGCEPENISKVELTEKEDLYYELKSYVLEDEMYITKGYVTDRYIVSANVVTNSKTLETSYSIKVNNIIAEKESCFEYSDNEAMEEEFKEIYEENAMDEIYYNLDLDFENEKINNAIILLEGINFSVENLQKLYAIDDKDMYFEILRDDDEGHILLEEGYIIGNYFIFGSKEENDEDLLYEYQLVIIDFENEIETTYEFENYLPMKKALKNVYESMYDPTKFDVSGANCVIRKDNNTDEVKTKRLR